MQIKSIAAVLLIVIVGLGLVTGGFSYTKQTYQGDVGSLQMSIDEKRHVNVPETAGIAAIVVAGLCLVGSKKTWTSRPNHQDRRSRRESVGSDFGPR